VEELEEGTPNAAMAQTGMEKKKIKERVACQTKAPLTSFHLVQE
jgi:hypothetical protein